MKTDQLRSPWSNTQWWPCAQWRFRLGGRYSSRHQGTARMWSDIQRVSLPPWSNRPPMNWSGYSSRKARRAPRVGVAGVGARLDLDGQQPFARLDDEVHLQVGRRAPVQHLRGRNLAVPLFVRGPQSAPSSGGLSGGGAGRPDTMRVGLT